MKWTDDLTQLTGSIWRSTDQNIEVWKKKEKTYIRERFEKAVQEEE